MCKIIYIQVDYAINKYLKIISIHANYDSLMHKIDQRKELKAVTEGCKFACMVLTD